MASPTRVTPTIDKRKSMIRNYIGKMLLSTCAALCAGAWASNDSSGEVDRQAECQKNYRILFGGEALTGKGNDPEMMAILQKVIFGDVFSTGVLSIKERELITCVTLATLQTLPQLKAHAQAALNVGISPVELREAMYLTAPFIGFPRMLNAVATVNEVFQDRGIALPLESQGTVTDRTRTEQGRTIQEKLYPGGIEEAMKGVPGKWGGCVEELLTAYCFGDVYTRNGLDLGMKELLGYCVLTTLEADSQLKSHFSGNMKAGNSPEKLAAAVVQTLPYIGFPAAIKSLQIIKQETVNSSADDLVRLSLITVDSRQLEAYKALLKEEIEASMQLEPGVLVLYAVFDQQVPNKVTILEIYTDRSAYEKHLQTPHFQKYKQGTKGMVQDLKLIDTTPLIPGLKIK